MNESILTFRCYRKKYNFRKLKKYIIIMIIFISIIIPTKVFADTENEIMNNTQEKFNINSFIKEADKYTGDFLEDVNLGDMLNQAIQGKVDNKTLYQKTANKLEYLTSFHKKMFHRTDEELLWTLFSLQHGISRLNSAQDETRGQGTIDLIDSFQKLGRKYDKDGNIQKPIMSITSGNINILFDGTYTIREDENNLKVIAFNAENSLKNEPDEKYVKNIGNYFPGTVISIKFFIDREYIEELKKNE